jgi:hypothetical protein
MNVRSYSQNDTFSVKLSLLPEKNRTWHSCRFWLTIISFTPSPEDVPKSQVLPLDEIEATTRSRLSVLELLFQLGNVHGKKQSIAAQLHMHVLTSGGRD